VVLERLADLRERGEKTREMVVSAMLYPAILVVVSLSSVFLLLAFVVPQFETIFKDAGAALPTPTAIVIAIGRFAQNYGWLLGLGIVVAMVAIRQLLAMPGPRLAWDRAALRLPLFGPLLRLLATARFCRTLSTLVGNGVDLPSANCPVARRDLEHRRRRRDGDRHERRATRAWTGRPAGRDRRVPAARGADAAGRRRNRQDRRDRSPYRRRL